MGTLVLAHFSRRFERELGSRKFCMWFFESYLLAIPLIWTICATMLQHSSYFMYADDLAICVSHKDPEMLQTLLQSDLNRVSLWCDSFRLTVNSDKTHVLWCQSEGEGRNLADYSFVLNGKVLRVVGLWAWNEAGGESDHFGNGPCENSVPWPFRHCNAPVEIAKTNAAIVDLH